MNGYDEYLIQTDVERLMVKLGKQLEEGTEDFSKLAEEKAIADAVCLLRVKELVDWWE